MEIWKDIKGFENNYQISNFGNVKNKQSNKLLKGDTNTAGYKRITLYFPIKKRYFIHRLVAIHFCKGYDETKVVNHKDGNKQNNYATNLEWVSRSQNDLHAYKLGLRKCHPCQFKHKIEMFDKNNRFIKEFDNIQKCCDYLKVSRPQVYNCCNNKAFTCRGYILKYKK